MTIKVNRQVVLGTVGASLLVASAYLIGEWQSADTITRVVDGDTLVINGRTRVRLWGIDAPELEQQCWQPISLEPGTPFEGAEVSWPCGQQAKAYLQSFFALPSVTLHCARQSWWPSYGRRVMLCTVTNKAGDVHDIGKSLVAAGYALDWPQYSKGHYAADQAYAQTHKLGVWQGSFELPWDWRREHK